MKTIDVRQEIITTACDFNISGLSVGTSGNISVRVEQGFIITPTGMTYAEIKPEDLVLCHPDGKIISGDRLPSSELPFHVALYKTYKHINAIVHVHSPYASGIACTRKSIPAFHYMVAVAGGDTIPCADYATFGSDQLSENVVNVLRDRKACLLANHGMVATGDTIESTYKLAQEVEDLARQYWISLQSGSPVILDDDEMKINVAKFQSYGKQGDN